MKKYVRSSSQDVQGIVDKCNENVPELLSKLMDALYGLQSLQEDMDPVSDYEVSIRHKNGQEYYSGQNEFEDLDACKHNIDGAVDSINDAIEYLSDWKGM